MSVIAANRGLVLVLIISASWIFPEVVKNDLGFSKVLFEGTVG